MLPCRDGSDQFAACFYKHFKASSSATWKGSFFIPIQSGGIQPT